MVLLWDATRVPIGCWDHALVGPLHCMASPTHVAHMSEIGTNVAHMVHNACSSRSLHCNYGFNGCVVRAVAWIHVAVLM